ncbi:MAG: hypothetical protein QG654_501 [Patescibacteria group bacterium]|nr:hypothetical protein [Patescibacteria group bacterium]
MNLLFLLTDEQVANRYKKAGLVFGDAVSRLYFGECIGFEKMLGRWGKWEAEYAKRGYKTFSLDQFVHASCGNEEVLHPRYILSKDEPPVLHSQIYREKYLGKVKPTIDISRLMEGEVQSGSFKLPTTES